MTAIISAFQKNTTKARLKPKKETRGRMDTASTIKLYERLKSVLTPAENGLFTYADGVNDKKIAEEFGIKERAVMLNRIKLFGKLKIDGNYVPYSVLLQKHHDLERRLASLEEALGVKP